jgi:two-component system chemotaxis response regulator CheB
MNTHPDHITRKTPIRVLVVDDSPTVRELLTYLFASDPDFQVVGTAANGEDAVAAVSSKKPDVVTMDIHMPRMNGYAATRTIMETCPVPIVIVTGSLSEDEIRSPFAALEAGAVAVIRRPESLHQPSHAAHARALIQTVKLMSEIKVVRRWAEHPAVDHPPSKPYASESPVDIVPQADLRIVAIGASTGGPLVLRQILSQLPKPFPVPILGVQHITEGVLEGFAEWLAESCGFPVHVARDGEIPLAGHIYLAPDGKHMSVNRQGRIALWEGDPEQGHVPSVSCLFRSVAEVYGAHAAGVLLTGMGRDGAVGLGKMKEAGAVTFAQDRASSVVFGMPGEAIRLGAASHVLPPESIAASLASLARQGESQPASK